MTQTKNNIVNLAKYLREKKRDKLIKQLEQAGYTKQLVKRIMENGTVVDPRSNNAND